MATWKWLSTAPTNGILIALHSPDADAKSPLSVDLPAAVGRVVLFVELVLVSSGAFLLLVSTSVFGSLLRSSLGDNVFVHICENAAFSWGLVILMTKFLQLPNRNFVRRLLRFRWSGVKTCIVSVLCHSMAVMVFRLWTKDQGLVSWGNVDAAVRWADGSLATEELVQKLVLAPIKEELLFRGVVMLVAMNRLQNDKRSASVSSFLFVAIHLVNARHIGSHYSTSYVAFQLLWAWLVGLFLALNLAISGSLAECVVLHAINNVFALGVSKTSTIDVTQPSQFFSVLLALTIYLVAIARQLQLLNGVKIATEKQA